MIMLATDHELRLSCALGDCSRASRAIAAGADVNAIMLMNLTHLHFAAKISDLNIMQLLCDHGADVNAVDTRGRSPIFDACVSGKLGAVRLLWKCGADINVTSQSRSTPLIIAALQGAAEIVEFLIDKGTNVNHIDSTGRSALFGATRQCAKLLLAAGANPKMANWRRPWIREFLIEYIGEVSEIRVLIVRLTRKTDINVAYMIQDMLFWSERREL